MFPKSEKRTPPSLSGKGAGGLGGASKGKSVPNYPLVPTLLHGNAFPTHCVIQVKAVR